jgi:hypothetical protein
MAFVSGEEIEDIQDEVVWPLYAQGEERLREAVGRAEGGSVDADLGGGLIKQRVARQGQGRSGGYRTVIAYHTGTRSVFLYGFTKNERDNIDEGELDDFKKLARRFLTMTNRDLERATAEGELIEVTDD